jgi:two-component system nitrogen regulation response regulator GlnG
MRRVADQIERLADSTAPALIVGEPGTGRELIARVLHFVGPRRGRRLIAVDAGTNAAGRFRDAADATSQATLRAAAGGTLMIKNLCELPRAGQRRLLGVLRAEHEEAVDVRFVGSSDPDLEAAVSAGIFRDDLHRLFDASRIEVPPLRDRAEDVPVLAGQLIRDYGREIGRNKMTLSTRAHERLVKYPWPGNVAELKGVARRLVYRAAKSRIEAAEVDAVLPQVAERVPLEDMPFEQMIACKLAAFLRRMDGYPVADLYGDVIARVERPLLDLVMTSTGGNQVRAAEILGLNRATLRRKLDEHGMLTRMRTRAVPRHSALDSNARPGAGGRARGQAGRGE